MPTNISTNSEPEIEKNGTCLTGDSLGQHGLAGSRRADEQDALWHGGADIGVLLRIVQIIDDLRKALPWPSSSPATSLKWIPAVDCT